MKTSNCFLKFNFVFQPQDWPGKRIDFFQYQNLWEKVFHSYSTVNHRYAREIPKPASFLWHWAQKWGYSGFSRDQNNHDSSGAYCGLSMNMCEMPHGAWRLWIAFCLRIFPHVWSAKTWRPPIWAPWLMTPLHGAVYEVWDLPCIYLCSKRKSLLPNMCVYLCDCPLHICIRLIMVYV